MKKITAVCLTLLLSIFSLTAQEATICFKVDKRCQTIIYEPIDGAYNRRVPIHELVLSPDSSQCHKIAITTSGIVYLQFPQYQKTCRVFLFPNDSVEISINNQGLKFKGSNGSGQQFFYDSFTSRPFGDTYQKMQDIIQEYTDHRREIKSVVPTIYNQLMLPYLKKVNELTENSSIMPAFADVLKKEIDFIFIPYLVDFFNVILQKKDDFGIVISDERIIEQQADSLLNLYPINKELLKYDSRLFVIKYLKECGKTKGDFNPNDKKTFGPYKTYLLAPIEMHPDLLGNACMVQLKYNTEEMDLEGVRKYFNREFPNHPYTAIINKQIEAIPAPSGNNEKDFAPVFIEENITSLSALVKTQELKGKYLFIDLWASWCMPCRAEFSYKSKLEELLDTYDNIATVYISIDGAKQEKAWRNCIDYYKLKSFHLRATSALQENIKKEIYKEKKVEIPRYILIGPEGKILNNDLPRPSKYPQLKEALEKVIK